MDTFRIAIVTDCHNGFVLLGGEEYWSQTPFVNGQRELYRRLKLLCDEEHVDAIVHLGDGTHNGTETEARTFLDLLASLERRSILTLGNHDVPHPESLAMWREIIAEYPNIHCDTPLLYDFGPLAVATLRNTWLNENGSLGDSWNMDSRQYPLPGLDIAELEAQSKQIASLPKKPVLLGVHAPSWLFIPGKSQATVGIDAMAVLNTYSLQLAKLIGAHENIRLLASGHVHSVKACQFGAAALSCSAFFEAPFSVRVVTVDDHWITIDTHDLLKSTDQVQPRDDQLERQGTLEERSIVIPRLLQ